MKDSIYVRIIQSRYTNIGMGMVLVFTGLFEMFHDVLTDFFGVSVRLHHGIILYGLYQVINSVIAIIQGHQYVLDKNGSEAGGP